MPVKKTADPSTSVPRHAGTGGMTKERAALGPKPMRVERTADPSTSVGMTRRGRRFGSNQMLVERTADPSTSVGTEGLADFAEMKKQNGRTCWSARFLFLLRK
jgi:hypothetical protein